MLILDFTNHIQWTFLQMSRSHIDYNAPLVLSFTLACGAIFVLDRLVHGWLILNFFSISRPFSFLDPISYLTLVSHVFGHATPEHLILNLSIILLVGPILEEKYGTQSLLTMCLVTALITGILNNLLFSTGLLGASGLAFMFIVLSSFANAKAGTIPLTFILVALIYVGNEFFQAFQENNISEFAHILGGVCGSIFGYYRNRGGT